MALFGQFQALLLQTAQTWLRIKMKQTLIVEELLVQSAVMGGNAIKTLIAALMLVSLVFVKPLCPF
jgi:hypothetical protein